MKQIYIYGDNYNSKLFKVREACRAFIVNNGKILISYESMNNQLMLPGGGIEENKSHIDTLIRVTKEETGLVIKPNTIKECGLILEIRKSIYNDDIFYQKSYYYFAEVEDIVLRQKLTENEKELQYVLGWVDPNYTYQVNLDLSKEYKNKFLLRETCV